MTDDLGACGGGGWTLVMKMDGNKVLIHLSVLLFLILKTIAIFTGIVLLWASSVCWNRK